MPIAPQYSDGHAVARQRRTAPPVPAGSLVPTAPPVPTGGDERLDAALLRLLNDLHLAELEDRQKSIGLILDAVCRYTGWPFGHAYRLERGTGRLRPAMVWHEREPGRFRSAVDLTLDALLGPGEDLPGLALASRGLEWTDDISLEARFERNEVVRTWGVRSAVAVPIVVNGNVDLVLEFFCPKLQSEDEGVLTVLGHVGTEWGRVLEIERLEDELRQNLNSFRTIAESSRDAIVLVDDVGRIVSLNPSARRLFGYGVQGIVGRPLPTLLSASSHERYGAAFARLLDRPSGISTDPLLSLEGITREGRVFPVTLSLSCWTARRRYVAATLWAETDRRADEDDFRLHGLAAAHVRDAIVVSTVGRAGRGPTILYVNSAFTRMTGYVESEVLGRSFSLLAGAKTNRVALQVLNQRFCRGESASVELIAYGKDGHEFLLEWHASPIVAADGNVHHVASIQRDITEERSVERALRRADRDTLTGLPTRALLENRVRHSIGRSKERTDYRFALLFLDMDGFKAVNDEYGHVVGDQLLASAARRLEGTIRPGDALARFGGDEFVILFHYVTDISDVVLVAERVRECMAAPFEIQGTSLTVAASIGIALSSSGYDHPEEVIRDADAAMYEAKRKGRGRVEFFGRSPDGSLEPTLQLL